MQNEIKVDEKVLKDFLKVIFRGCDDFAFALSYKDGSFKNDWKRIQKDLDPIVHAIRVVNESKSTCAYISANLFSPQNTHGRKVEDVLALRALVVDIDFWSDEPGVRNHGKKDQCVPEGDEPNVDEVLKGLHQKGDVSFVVNTGHGRQAWLLLPDRWALETEKDRSRANALSKGFSQFVRQQLEHAEVHSGVDGSPDIAHIWRIPGTVNRKGETPVPVTFSLPDNGTRAEAEEIEALLNESGIELQQQPVQRACDFPDVLSPLSGEGLKRLEVALENHSGLQALWEGDRQKIKSLMPGIEDVSDSGCLFHFARLLARDFQWSEKDVAQAIVSVARKNEWRHRRSRGKSILAKLFDNGEPSSASQQTSGTNSKRKKGDRAPVDILKEIALREFTFVWAGDNEAFAVPRGRNRRALRIDSEDFEGLMGEMYEREKKKLPPPSSVRAIMPSLLHLAKKGERKRIWRRVAMPSDGTIVIDLYQQDCPSKCVVITADGATVQDTWPNGVIFDTSAAMAALPTPEKGLGTLEDIRQALGMAGSSRKDDWRLIVGFLVSSFFPMKDHPILVFEGKSGSGKSFAMGQLRRLIDPHGVDDDDNGSSIPKILKELAGKIRDEFFMVFDNVGQITRAVSDELCQMVKGSYKIQTRKLYNTALLATFFGPSFVGLSMIETSTTPPDLLGRVLRIEFDRPKQGWELPPDKAVSLVSRSLPGALVELHSLVAEVIRELPASRPSQQSRTHRLYDFQWILTAVDRIRGWNTTDAFLRASSAVQEDAIADLPITDVLLRALAAKEDKTFTGSLRKFLEYLEGFHPRFPWCMSESGVLKDRGTRDYSTWNEDKNVYQALAGMTTSWLQKHAPALEIVGFNFKKLGGGPPAEWRFWLEGDAA